MTTQSDDSTRFVTSQPGLRLAYRLTEGAGPVVVFFPGYASDMRGTKALYLERRCRERGRAFLRFDYSGHGESQGCFADGTIGQWTQDALAVIRVATAERLLLVGSSMGGWTMLLAALELRERVAAMVGVAAAPDFTEDLMWRTLSEEQRSALREHGELYLPSEYVDDPHPITLKLIEEARGRLLLQAPVAVECPVRLIHGLEDPDVPWETSVRLARRLASRDVRVLLLKGGGHRLSGDAELRLIADTVEELARAGE